MKKLLTSTLMVVVATAMFGCVADDSTDGQYNVKGPQLNENEMLVVNLGASITNGYTFDPTLLGIPLDPVWADNAWAPRFTATIGQAMGTEVDSYDLSVPGATSTEILNQQLPDALEEIPRYARGAVITIEAGGNDLRAFVADDAVMEACMLGNYPVCFGTLEATLTTIDANLRSMLAQLREVAPYAPIIVMTQYDPMWGTAPTGQNCAVAKVGEAAAPQLLQLAEAAFEGIPGPNGNGSPVLGMNWRIRAAAADYGAAVADISGYLHGADGTSTEFMNPIYYSADCTHPSGTRAALPYVGLPADTIGAGEEALYNVFAYALMTY